MTRAAPEDPDTSLAILSAAEMLDIRDVADNLFTAGVLRREPGMLRSPERHDDVTRAALSGNGDPTAWIRVSHQPNLFAYWKLVGQLVNAGLITRHLKGKGILAQAVYLYVDYDVISDRHVERAVLPRVGRRQNLGIRLTRAAGERSRVIGMAIPPAPLWFKDVARTIELAGQSYVPWVSHELRSELGAAVGMAVAEATALQGTGSGYGEIAAQFACAMASAISGAEIRFVSGLAIFMAEQEAIYACLERSTEIINVCSAVAKSLGDGARVPTGPADLAWGLCGCGSRLRLSEAPGRTAPSATCGGCGDNWRWGQLVLPRVLVDDLLDGQIFSSHLALSHSGSLSHLRASHMARQGLGLKRAYFEIASHATFDGPCIVSGDFAARVPTDSSDGPDTGARSREGQFSSLYYGICLRLAAAQSALLSDA